MTVDSPRWERDARGTGVADGRWFADRLERLRGGLAEPTWVTESPEEHILPHLARGVEVAGSPWLLIEATMTDGVYWVSLEWHLASPRLRQLRTDTVRLIGEIAEGTTLIDQVIADDAIEYHVVTGQLGGTTPFAPHGHLIRLIIRGPAIPALIAGAREQPPLLG